jgi:hypothetical protein
MKDFEKYMLAYWAKYPIEEKHDYTIDELSGLIDGGAMYHLTEYIFVVYKVIDDCANIIFYCADGGSHDSRTKKHILLQHRRFINSLGVPAFIANVNDLFKRDSISRYDEDKKQWRFL